MSDVKEEYFIVACPHCQDLMQIFKQEIGCKIFRHAIFTNGQPINPHLPEAECKKLVEQDLIYGCAKPFFFDGVEIKACGYI